jgi:hypothetical protein
MKFLEQILKPSRVMRNFILAGILNRGSFEADAE